MRQIHIGGEMYTLSITIAILSQILYHVAQKSLPEGARPFLLLAIVYSIAAVGCAGLAAIGGKAVTAADLKPLLSWPVLLLIVSVVGIEFGFLLAYRQGWAIGLAYSVSSTVTMVLLAILGLFLFRESLNLWQISGLGLALAGTWLMTIDR